MKFSVLHTPKPCCENPEDCCKDRAEHFQLKNDFLFSADCIDFNNSCLELPLLVVIDQVPVQLSAILSVRPDESPPPLLDVRLALLQQYLI
jgi:hypothetical protein